MLTVHRRMDDMENIGGGKTEGWGGGGVTKGFDTSPAITGSFIFTNYPGCCVENKYVCLVCLRALILYANGRIAGSIYTCFVGALLLSLHKGARLQNRAGRGERHRPNRVLRTTDGGRETATICISSDSCMRRFGKKKSCLEGG